MKWNIQYGTDVLSLPADILNHTVPDAGYVYVLMILASPDSRHNDTDRIAKRCGFSPAYTEKALRFWQDCGILSREEDDSTLTADVSDGIALVPAADTARTELLSYPQETVSAVLAEHSELSSALNVCENLCGKIFSPHETEQLVALYDSYGLSADHLVTLFSYCCKKGKSNVGYVVRTALEQYGEGIRTVEALEARIAQNERNSGYESAIRRMFGLGSRALSKKEETFIHCWFEEWHFSEDMVTHAYEICVNRNAGSSFSYIDAILKSWHEAGICTVDAAIAAEQAYKAERAPKNSSSSYDGKEHSFALDDFVKAAIENSHLTES